MRGRDSRKLLSQEKVIMEKENTGINAIRNPYINQGTAFNKKARAELKLQGLLPPKIQSIEIQEKHFMDRLKNLEANLDKYMLLDGLRSRNRTLFFYVLRNNIEELLPIVYTPTIGKACSEFSQFFENTIGLYLTIEDKGYVGEILDNFPENDIEVIVVTDGERVLGLGDLGCGGMGISKAVSELCTSCAGIDPKKVLPVLVDVGTNNVSLLNDPLYIGLSHNRITGKSYFDLFEEFIVEAKKRWPNAIVQFEAFANKNAFQLLDIWREKVNCFNNEIQGTAAVAVAGLHSAVRIKGTQLKDEKFLFFGAGEAALGIANLLTEAIVDEGATPEEARQRITLFDSHGLVTASREDLSDLKGRYAHDIPDSSTFLEALENVKPTAIIGVAAQAGAFNAYVLGTMARINERPIIFSLSNPTVKSECTARDAYFYTVGKGIFACGSPFAKVEYEDKVFIPRQCNNAYVFPGINLGLTAVKAKQIPDGVFLVAAKALADSVTEEDLEAGSLYPPVRNTLHFSWRIARAVGQYCRDKGIAEDMTSDLDLLLKNRVYEPHYPEVE